MSNSVCPFWRCEVLARRLSAVVWSSLFVKLLVAARDTRLAVAAVRPSWDLNSSSERSEVRLLPGFGLLRSASDSLAKAFITDELSQVSGDVSSPIDGVFLLLHVTYTEVLGWGAGGGEGSFGL